MSATKKRRGHKWSKQKQTKSDWKKALNEIYTTVGQAGAFSSSPFRLSRELKKRYRIVVPQTKIQNWLAGKVSHNIHRVAKLKFKRNPIIAPDIDYQWQGDLLFLNELSKYNKGYKIALVMIDVVSRFAWGSLMKNKSGPSTTEAFNDILKQAYPRIPVKIQTDKGTEFLNSKFQALLKKRNIIFFTTDSDTKAAIVERFIQTLKKLIYKYLTENNTNSYYKQFQNIIKTYNNTYHSTIKFAPTEVSRSNQAIVMTNLYGHLWEADTLGTRKPNLFKVNDYVRISKIHTKVFRKSYKGNWTDEIFTISEIKNEYGEPTYGVKDVHGKEIMGSFYEAELQKIPDANIDEQYWTIEKILKTKQTSGGKKQFFVKWNGFDESHNSWVSADKMKTVRK